MSLLSLFFLLTIFLNGSVLTKFLFKKTETLFFWASSFLLGSLASVEIIFVLAWLLTKEQYSLQFALLIYALIAIVFLLKNNTFLKSLPKKLSIVDVIFLFFISTFSFYIFTRSFSYDSSASTLLVASNSYLDFGTHLPFIRSFSFGHNFPPQLPFFGGKPALYHFMFDFYAGVLEFLGTRIDFAFNLISAFSLISLLIMVFSVSRGLFKSIPAAILSCIFLLFNGTLTFVLFLQKNPLGSELINKIRNYNIYLDNGPFGESPVSIFWNLNTFLNQRQFIFALAIFFLIVFWLFSTSLMQNPKRALLVGIFIGILPLWHSQIFLMMLMLVVLSFFLTDKIRLTTFLLVAALLFSLPQMILIKSTLQNQIIFRPGFLVADNLSLVSFNNYWFWNLGFYIPVLFMAFWFIKGKARKLFYLSLAYFLAPNLWQFSREMFNNHKFLNVFAIFAAIFASYFVVFIYQKNIIGKIIASVLVIILTVSGLLSFFVIKNDVWAKFPDYPKDEFLAWIVKNTDKSDLFLTNGDIYDPITLVGRKTFLGRVHFVWAYGGEPQERQIEQNEVLNCIDDIKCLDTLQKNHISYIVLYKQDLGIETKEIKINKDFFLKNFKKVYESNKEMVFKI